MGRLEHVLEVSIGAISSAIGGCVAHLFLILNSHVTPLHRCNRSIAVVIVIFNPRRAKRVILVQIRIVDDLHLNRRFALTDSKLHRGHLSILFVMAG